MSEIVPARHARALSERYWEALEEVSGEPLCPTLLTDRLTLRLLEPEDQDFLTVLDTSPEGMKFIHNGALKIKHAQITAEYEIEAAPGAVHLHKWLVERRADRRRLGWVELSNFQGRDDGHDINQSGLRICSGILGLRVCNRSQSGGSAVRLRDHREGPGRGIRPTRQPAICPCPRQAWFSSGRLLPRWGRKRVRLLCPCRAKLAITEEELNR
jgi:hypothetical protein